MSDHVMFLCVTKEFYDFKINLICNLSCCNLKTRYHKNLHRCVREHRSYSIQQTKLILKNLTHSINCVLMQWKLYHFIWMHRRIFQCVHMILSISWILFKCHAIIFQIEVSLKLIFLVAGYFQIHILSQW